MVAKVGSLYAVSTITPETSHVMRWMKCTGWQVIGELFIPSGIDLDVSTMCLGGENLFIGGTFITPVPGTTATNIAKCNLLT
jgi:hypothetical protein